VHPRGELLISSSPACSQVGGELGATGRSGTFGHTRENSPTTITPATPATAIATCGERRSASAPAARNPRAVAAPSPPPASPLSRPRYWLGVARFTVTISGTR